MTIARANKSEPYRVTTIPMPARHGFTVGRRRTSVLVFISEAHLNLKASVRLVARIYALTPAESRLLDGLVEGRPLKRTATILGISVHTAHSQLNNIFRKTGTHRQTDLVRLAMSLVNSTHVRSGVEK